MSALACERNVLRYRPTAVVVRAEAGTHLADLVRVLAAGVRAAGPLSLSVAEPLPPELGAALTGAGVVVAVERGRVWGARLADTAACGPQGARVRILGPRAQSARERWEQACRATSGSPDVALYTGAVTACPHTELLPFLREQAVSVTAHRFGTPLDLAAGLL